MTTYLIFYWPEVCAAYKIGHLEPILGFLGCTNVPRLSISSVSATRDDGSSFVLRDQQVSDCLVAIRADFERPATMLLGTPEIGKRIAKEAALITSQLANDFVPSEFLIRIRNFEVTTHTGDQQSIETDFAILLTGEGCPDDLDVYLEEFRQLPTCQRFVTFLRSIGFGNTELGIQST